MENIQLNLKLSKTVITLNPCLNTNLKQRTKQTKKHDPKTLYKKYSNEACTQVVIIRFERLTKIEIVNHIMHIVSS